MKKFIYRVIECRVIRNEPGVCSKCSQKEKLIDVNGLVRGSFKDVSEAYKFMKQLESPVNKTEYKINRLLRMIWGMPKKSAAQDLEQMIERRKANEDKYYFIKITENNLI